jgi:tetratricopeptide (TPR) repeat protein
MDNSTSFWDKLAIKSYKELIKHRTNAPNLYIGLGLAYGRQEQYASAVKSLKKALQMDTASVAAYHLGQIYQILKKTDEAMHYLKHYITVNKLEEESVPCQLLRRLRQDSFLHLENRALNEGSKE